MANPDRLTALDSTFLHLEDHSTAHMHVASVMVFEGDAPSLKELVEHVNGRLHLVPRYRQRLAYVPFGQGRPVWTDDPHFNPYYHIRHTALPEAGGRGGPQAPGGTDLLPAPGSLQAPVGDLARAEHVRRALRPDRKDPPRPRGRHLRRGHHHRPVRHRPRTGGADAPATPWAAKPLPGQAKLLGEAIIERSTVPGEMVRGARAVLRRPRRAVSRFTGAVTSIGATTIAGIQAPAPSSPFNVEIGPHRRYTFLDVDIASLKAVKDSLGGTLNDTVLASVSLALGRYLRRHGHETDDLVLKAMVPVSVRTKAQRGALGNQVAAMWAPLPVGVQNAAEVLRKIASSMDELKKSGQAVGAQVLTNLAGFAPPTILSQAARLQARQPFFNLVVTNVPGPQFPLYLLGRRLEILYPVVPLAQKQALGIAVMSYDGHLGFGLLGDYDALPDIEELALDLKWAVAALCRAAGVRPRVGSTRKSTSKRTTANAGRRTSNSRTGTSRRPAGTN